jgi:hypothetical protein
MKTGNALRKALTAYLDRIGQLSPALGEAEAGASGPTKNDNEFLRAQLAAAAQKNDLLIWLAAGVLISLFAFCLAIVAFGTSNGKIPSSLLGGGGSILSLLAVVRWLRQLWFDRSTLNLLALIAGTLPPADAASLIAKFYFDARATANSSDTLRPKSRKRRQPRSAAAH